MIKSIALIKKSCLTKDIFPSSLNLKKKKAGELVRYKTTKNFTQF